MPLPRTTAEVRTLYRWDKNSLRYIDQRGRFVKSADVRKALSDVVNANKRQIRALARQLNNGTLSVQQWQASMETAVRDLHLGATAAGKGGFGQMTQRDYGLAGQRIQFHFAKLDGFARDVEAGRISAGRVVARAELYARAGVGVYENARREAARGVMTEERRVLGAAEHCGVCVEEAAKGWQPIGTLKRLGDSPCLANCRCSYRFRKQAA
jgi:bacterioferritin-associated ferredoxin